MPGLINVDFADVRTIMQARGRALMGIGVAEGEDRAVRAASEAIICPLLEQSNIEGAMGVIVNVKAGCDIRMREVQDAVTTVQRAAHPKSNIIFGAVVEEEERPDLQVTVIAAGFDAEVQRNLGGADKIERPAPHIVRLKTPDPAPGPAADASAVPISAGAKGQVEYLFPQDDPNQPPLAKVEPDEDLGIPAFMRRRRNKS